RAISRARGVPVGSLVPGAGSSGLIFTAFQRWLTRESRALILDPMYGEYAHVLEHVVGCRVDRLELEPDDEFRGNLDRLAESASRGYDLVVLVNPNNPTGKQIPQDQLRGMLEGLPRTTRVWIDETYADYAGPGQTLEAFAAASDNVVICKSLSKVFALS